LFVLLLFCFLACKKEDPPPEPPPPPTEYVPIFAPCDTSDGVATANKLTAAWKAGISCRSILSGGEKFWVLDMLTCSESKEIREHIIIGGVADNNPVQRYGIKKVGSSLIAESEGFVQSSYGTLASDGDLVEDFYYVDTTFTDDFLEIDVWDTANKRAEGRFSMSFYIKEPQGNPKNPKKVRFTSGKFWVRLP
jgi:hypothetical protein